MLEKQGGEFYLCVSRLIKHKRIDLVIEAFKQLGQELYIIGEGAELNNLQRQAAGNVHLLGRQSDDVVRDYYGKCKAFVFPTEEDFGITPVEAQASGKPVIAYGRGGALETVIEGVTGTFFYEQSVESLIEAVRRFESMDIKDENCRKNAEKFSDEIYYKEMKGFIEDKWRDFKAAKELNHENKKPDCCK